MKIAYTSKNFRSDSLAIIAQANNIIHDYAAQGFLLTLRQLYYQFVARDLIPNTERSYKRLGKIINDARMCGLIDWDAIEDRTRNIYGNRHWTNPKGAIKQLRDQYGIDMWRNQPVRVEVWIEKEALTGVIEDVCSELDVPYFACRGYVSQSEQWRAGRRAYFRYNDHVQETVILHFGDHDPSGIDMTRDNEDRLFTFGEIGAPEIVRVALNLDQINEYRPPPNPAKTTDSRFESYIRQYGPDSWELDALEPKVIVQLVRDHVTKYRDETLWDEMQELWQEHLDQLDTIIGELE